MKSHKVQSVNGRILILGIHVLFIDSMAALMDCGKNRASQVFLKIVVGGSYIPSADRGGEGMLRLCHSAAVKIKAYVF